MLKLGIGNEASWSGATVPSGLHDCISYKWYAFGVERSKVKVGIRIWVKVRVNSNTTWVRILWVPTSLHRRQTPLHTNNHLTTTGHAAVACRRRWWCFRPNPCLLLLFVSLFEGESKRLQDTCYDAAYNIRVMALQSCKLQLVDISYSTTAVHFNAVHCLHVLTDCWTSE